MQAKSSKDAKKKEEKKIEEARKKEEANFVCVANGLPRMDSAYAWKSKLRNISKH